MVKKNSPTHISSRLINVITSKTQNEMKMNIFLVYVESERDGETWAEYYALEV